MKAKWGNRHYNNRIKKKENEKREQRGNENCRKNEGRHRSMESKISRGRVEEKGGERGEKEKSEGGSWRREMGKK